jgi:hypothetical protein
MAMSRDRTRAVRDERRHISKPQVFVQVQFGVSWSEQHTPRNHTVSYTSRNLKENRNFPRQAPSSRSTTDALTHHPAMHRQRPQTASHHGQDRNARGFPGLQEYGRSYSNHHSSGRLPTMSQSRMEPRSRSAGASNNRDGQSLPIFHNSPWCGDEGPSSTTFPPPARTSRDASRTQEISQARPEQYRLGSEGMPWCGWSWPEGVTGVDPPDEGVPYANRPTTIPLSSERQHADDPAKAWELERLSSAMVTVDNGFENQWWYQGERESVGLLSSEQPEETSRSDDSVLLSAYEPTLPTEGDWMRSRLERSPNLHSIVSPISDVSSSPSLNFRGLDGTLTSMSDELFLRI